MDEVFQPLKPTKWVTEAQYAQRLKRKKIKRDNKAQTNDEDEDMSVR